MWEWWMAASIWRQKKERWEKRNWQDWRYRKLKKWKIGDDDGVDKQWPPLREWIW